MIGHGLLSNPLMPVVLEVERADMSMSIDNPTHRRIQFYQRLGFGQLQVDYQPPPYPGRSMPQHVSLWIHPNHSEHPADAKEVVSEIFRTVYSKP